MTPDGVPTEAPRLESYIERRFTGPTDAWDAVHNPASPEQVVGHVARATKEDAIRAVEAASAARPEWAALSYAERGEALRAIARRLDEVLPPLSELLVRENGKVLREAQLEMTRVSERFLITADLAEELAREERLAPPPFETAVSYHPMGVATLIVPYNWPISILGAKLPQALMAGNTAVVKPPPTCPLVTTIAVVAAAELLPPGVLNVVNGPAGEIGEVLVGHPAIRVVDITGGVETGRAIMGQAAKTLTRVTLELGGNDPALVLDDVDVDEGVIGRLTAGAFTTAGQICMAIKRLYVHRSKFESVRDGMAELLSTFVVGDGLDPQTTMGPLNNEDQLRTVQQLVDDARQRGARVQEHGKPLDPDAFSRGWFHLPTLVTGVDQDAAVVTEEQFGPVLPLIAFADDDEAVALANDSRFGLASSVWSSDPERAEHVARRLHAGYTALNNHGPTAQDNRAPFGGVKDSGMGRELGIHGVRDFQDAHAISR